MQISIITLHEKGWSNRRISRELGIHRKTVSRYINGDLTKSSKCTNSIIGSEGLAPSKCPNSITGSSRGRQSECESYRDTIKEGLEGGLTAQRIHQDLVSNHGFTFSYQSVQRFVRKLEENLPVPFRRMECGPGEEVQVDFGSAAPIESSDGKRRRPHLFRMVLSHSRKGYSEVVPHQTTDHFIRALENGFRYFGGVPRKVVIDNLRAGVSRADWYEPEVNPKLRSFSTHYGTVILPTKVRMPRHKGKVERGVGYVKNNALKGRVFSSIAEQNRFLHDWERTVADTRIHGTTRQQVQQAFEKERPYLGELPADIFPCYEEGQRSVHRDQHVEVGRSYYSVPAEYVRRQVWVRYDSRTVRIYTSQMEFIASHVRVDPGKRSTTWSHIPEEKISGIERGEAWQLQKAGKIGSHALAWAKAMLKSRGLEGVRVLQGLIAMPRNYSKEQIDSACKQALTLEVFHLKDVKNLIRQPVSQQSLKFVQEHHLIRDVNLYAKLVPDVFDPMSKIGEVES